MPDFIFDSWSGMGRVALNAALAYLALVVFLRVSGKRTLTKLNAFDLVVTIALGSTLASVITSRTLPLAEGVFALFLLIAFQFLVTWSAVRFPAFDRIIKSEPKLLLRDGQPLEAAMRRERITLDELRAAVRQSGGADLQDAQAVYLETDGSLSARLA